MADNENQQSGVGKFGDDIPERPAGEPGTVPPKEGVEGYGTNVAPDPSLQVRENELREFAVANPADYADLADPRKSPEDLPPGVAVGGSMVRHHKDVPNFEGTDSGDPSSPGTVHAQPVRVDGRNRRSDSDALEGHGVVVVKGDHEGQKATFVAALEHNKSNGYPKKAFIRFTDTKYHTAQTVVPYDYLRPADTYLD